MEIQKLLDRADSRWQMALAYRLAVAVHLRLLRRVS